MDSARITTASDITGENSALAKRDQILSTLAQASETFLRGSLDSWTDNVLQVIREMGKALGLKRIFLCKHDQVTAEAVITSVRYEWLKEGDLTKVDLNGFQNLNLQAMGLGRWAGVLYHGGIVAGKREDIPQGEREGLMLPGWQSLIVVPVFVEREWWGFLACEDYPFNGGISTAELDAFKTVAVTFGAAIRRKRMEESLMYERAMVEEKAALIEDVARFPAEDPWPVLRVKKNGILAYANRAAESLLAQWGTKLWEAVPAEWQRTVAEVLVRKQAESVDVVLGKKTFSMLVVPVAAKDYANVYGHDVTRERELDRLKSEFLALASHQLRSPLTSIRWYSERLLMKKDQLDQALVEMVEVIHGCAVHLTYIVDELLNISRIERGKIEPKPAVHDLNRLIEEVLVELKGQIEESRLELETKLDQTITPFYFDEDLIRQVAMNLVTNAIKYSKPGGKIGVNSFWAGETEVGLEVRDEGIGIPAEEQDRVFSKFFRAANAVGHAAEGTGLGLALVKLIVDKSGGRINFTSTLDKGSTFTVVLPANPAGPPDSQKKV